MAVDVRAGARLREIAAVLGCPVEAFYAPDGAACDAGMTSELFRLWHAIQEPQGRQRVLNSARREVYGGATVAKAAE
ncbi:hypothetical protein MRF4_08930 [Methylobacterium radiotolerans]|uniref:XRE family transcriptional regulator n=1 Tax=Methylobacterium oryzae TaxID=334852 RepID=A0ABU7TK87_9HYPH